MKAVRGGMSDVRAPRDDDAGGIPRLGHDALGHLARSLGALLEHALDECVVGRDAAPLFAQRAEALVVCLEKALFEIAVADPAARVDGFEFARLVRLEL